MDIEPLVHKHFQLWKTQLGSKVEDTLRNALTEQAAYYENLVQVVSSKRVPDGYALALEGARLSIKELQHTVAQLTAAVDTDYEQLYREQLERANKLEAERVPDGYVLVQQFIHPLECAIGDNGDKVVQLLANAPDAGRFDNPQDFYQFWWQKLLLAAAPRHCHLCNYRHGHKIGCVNNPVDIALRAAAPQPKKEGE